MSVKIKKYMRTWIASAKAEEDISAVTEAMWILPILEIADALQDAMDKGGLQESEKLTDLISFIRGKGINAVDKY